MTTFNRPQLPDAVRTNGAMQNPWWANAVVYQIYPRSFQDTNNDGFGDIKGITSRLDYLADLGVDVLWLSPVYKSPQDDNGYDISDYQDIDPLFGSLHDMDELVREAHKRGLKIVMDLVVNHTSDEHEWFEASKNGDQNYADWYWWRPAKKGHVPGAPGAEPNNWGSYFGGSAWEYSPERGEYYLHQFSKKQPDLNWENPSVRRAVYDMMNWWLDRGIDGFRMDVITLISKHLDPNGCLAGEEDSLLEDSAVNEEGYSNPYPFCADGPRQDEFLAEMRREVFEGRNGFMTVGEAPGITPQRNEFITNPANGELDMLFLFDHVELDCDGVKWKPEDLDLVRFKMIMSGYQEAVREVGWASLFTGNHDQPRVVSRWGDDSSEEKRILSAKALGLMLHMHRGTPYIYQGEEFGMTNAYFTSLNQYRDLESINAFRQRVEEAKVQDAESMMRGLAERSRDNSRTPMQWDDSPYAGFTSEDATVDPWIEINPNHTYINACSAKKDPNSVYAFYQRLIELRHNEPIVSVGDWNLIDPQDDKVYAFTRDLRDEQVLVLVNMTGDNVEIPQESMSILHQNPVSTIDEGLILIANYSSESVLSSLTEGVLKPWEAVVLKTSR